MREYAENKTEAEKIIGKLKEKGCRITKQRRILINIILEGKCSCCKEIYYKASRQDPGIGIAMVYRMVNSLEEIGAISRRSIHNITCQPEEPAEICEIQLDDQSRRVLSGGTLRQVLCAGMKQCGYIKEEKIKKITISPCGR